MSNQILRKPTGQILPVLVFMGLYVLFNALNNNNDNNDITTIISSTLVLQSFNWTKKISLAVEMRLAQRRPNWTQPMVALAKIHAAIHCTSPPSG